MSERPTADDGPERLDGLDPHEAGAGDELDADGAFTDLQARIADEDRAPLAVVRAQPTSVRWLALVCACAAVVLAIGATARRADLDSLPTWRLALELGVLGATLAVTFGLALRPVFRPALRPGALAGWVLTTLLVTTLLGLWPSPAAAPRPVVELGPATPPDWSAGVPCLSVGLLVAIPVYLIARLLDRGSQASRWLATAGAALAANLALTIHCPIGDAAHKLSSHASLGFLLVGCLSLATLVERAASGRTT